LIIFMLCDYEREIWRGGASGRKRTCRFLYERYFTC